MAQVTVDGIGYTVSAIDLIRVAAGEWFEDEVTGLVDVTGEGHMAYDSIIEKATLEKIAFQVVANRHAERMTLATSHRNAQYSAGRS